MNIPCCQTVEVIISLCCQGMISMIWNYYNGGAGMSWRGRNTVISNVGSHYQPRPQNRWYFLTLETCLNFVNKKGDCIVIWPHLLLLDNTNSGLLENEMVLKEFDFRHSWNFQYTALPLLKNVILWHFYSIVSTYLKNSLESFGGIFDYLKFPQVSKKNQEIRTTNKFKLEPTSFEFE